MNNPLILLDSSDNLDVVSGYASEGTPSVRNCIVPKSLTLYTLDWFMGKRNKAVKLTRRKIKYIIRSKINNKSTKKDCRRDEGKHLYGIESLDVLAR